jgi:hypothetical protein
MRVMGSRDRRQRDRDQQRAAANRRIGHDHAYLIVGGPPLAKLLAVAIVVVGAWWAWTHVDHHRISLVLAVLGTLCVVVYAVWFAVTGNAHSRMMRRAQGEILTLSMWWHAVAIAAVLLFVAAYLVNQP